VVHHREGLYVRVSSTPSFPVLENPMSRVFGAPHITAHSMSWFVHRGKLEKTESACSFCRKRWMYHLMTARAY